MASSIADHPPPATGQKWSVEVEIEKLPHTLQTPENTNFSRFCSILNRTVVISNLKWDL
jgi:hypothetical protein